MKVIVEFDTDCDIIQVPDVLVPQLDTLRQKFLHWLYDPGIQHKYWKVFRDPSGQKITGISYRSDVFVEWLNKKVLKASPEKAAVLEACVPIKGTGLPKIFF